MFEKCQTQKFALSEARGGKKTTKRGGQASDFKRQLLEKQKMRFSYGISEKQLARYVREAMEHGGNPAQTLLVRLESRLDNVVYRLGLAKTRRLARQMVSHGHIVVNGRRNTIPSHHVNPEDTVSVREGSKQSALFTNLAERVDLSSIPVWLRMDLKEAAGQVISLPQNTGTESLFDPEQVFEYYSR